MDENENKKNSRKELEPVNDTAFVRRPQSLLKFALDQQLVSTVLISRATQTDWLWVKMALRWKHAKIMQSGQDMKREQEVTQAALDQLWAEIETPQEPTMPAMTDGQHHMFHRATQAGEIVHFPPALMPGPHPLVVPETMQPETGAFPPEVLDKQAISDWEDERRQHVPNFMTWDQSHPSTSPVAPLNSSVRFSQKQYDSARKHLEVMRLRECRDIDKNTDTSDLQFDPYDPDMRYTKKEIALEPAYIPHDLKDEIDQGNVSVNWEKKGSLFPNKQNKKKQPETPK